MTTILTTSGTRPSAALRVALAMLRSDATPATARASVVRALLGDAAARRHDDAMDGKEPWQMTAAEVLAEIEQSRRRLAPFLAEDAEVVDVEPAGGDVFG